MYLIHSQSTYTWHAALFTTVYMDSCPHLNARFFWPIQVHIPNGISVGSAISVQLIHTKKHRPRNTVNNRLYLCTVCMRNGLKIATARQHTHARAHAHTHTHVRLMALFPGLPGWAGTRKVNQSKFLWSKRQWVAVASAGPYASLHLAPDR